jgi:hypothetical protein
MLFDGRPMEDEKVDQQEVWSAIRYLDPDEKDKDKKGVGNTATIIAPLALLFIVQFCPFAFASPHASSRT